MERNERAEKTDLVWASIVILVLSFGAMILFLVLVPEMNVKVTLQYYLGVIIIIGSLLSLFNVTMLLSFTGSKKILLTLGRFILWLGFGCLALAGAWTIYMIVKWM